MNVVLADCEEFRKIKSKGRHSAALIFFCLFVPFFTPPEPFTFTQIKSLTKKCRIRGSGMYVYTYVQLIFICQMLALADWRCLKKSGLKCSSPKKGRFARRGSNIKHSCNLFHNGKIQINRLAISEYVFYFSERYTLRGHDDMVLQQKLGFYIPDTPCMEYYLPIHLP